ETDRKFQETDRKFQETDRKFQETDRKFQETDRKFQETDRKFQETDRMIQENAVQMRETERLVKAVSKQIGALGSRWGEFVESMVAPACRTLFQERGIPVHAVSQRVKAERHGRSMEIDLVVTNDSAAVLVEVKSRLTVDDIHDHVHRLQQYKEFFPSQANYRIMGAVTGMASDSGVEPFAVSQGLFVIVQAGDTLQLANPADFRPQIW
ncbi:MAG: DUF3782 domain-containing protein, partial [Magnetococcales bacterium]|nr:DUF3782 domain-containing protein [Magnetococcales bacterium]